MSTRTLHRRLLALTVAAGLALAACGGDDDDSAAETTARPAATTTASTDNTASGNTASEPADTTPATDAPDAPDTTEAAPTTEAPASNGPIVVEHEYGTTEVPSTPLRVVSASVTMTGPLLAIEAPVVASMATVPSKVADESGFFTQWADVAAERGVEPIPGPEINIEAIAAYEPDLIVGSAFGGDAVTEDIYALLSEVAPTVVINHSSLNVEGLTRAVAEATDRAAAADDVIAELDARIAEVAGQLDTSKPAAPVSIGNDGALNVLTPVSAHGQLLQQLGYTVPAIEATTSGELSGSGARQDVVELSPETVGPQLGDTTLFFIFAEQSDVDAAPDEIPTLAALPAYLEGRAVALGYESFRLDPFSARVIIDAIAAAMT